MKKYSLIDILIIIIGLAIPIILAIALYPKSNKATVKEIMIDWGSNTRKEKKSEYTIVIKKAYKSKEKDNVENLEISMNIDTSNEALINYAQKDVELKSSNWTLNDTYTDYVAPNEDSDVYTSNAKTIMKFQTLGYDSWNRQGHLCRQANAYTGAYGLRMIDNRILIALGSFFTKTIGTYIDVILEDGSIIPCMLGDAKSDKDTDATHRYQKYDKSVVEFIVDSPGIDRSDYSYFKTQYPEIGSNFTNIPEFSSPVVGIRVYDKVYAIDMTDLTNDNPDGR